MHRVTKHDNLFFPCHEKCTIVTQMAARRHREEMREQRRVFMDVQMCLGPVRDDSYAHVRLTPQKQGCQKL